MKSTKTDTGYTIQLNDEEIRAVAILARNRSTTPEAIIEGLFDTAIKIRTAGDLSPGEAGAMLGVSKFSIIRYYHAGLFPKAFQTNSRVIRIPRSDVEKLKAKRTPVAA